MVEEGARRIQAGVAGAAGGIGAGAGGKQGREAGGAVVAVPGGIFDLPWRAAIRSHQYVWLDGRCPHRDNSSFYYV